MTVLQLYLGVVGAVASVATWYSAYLHYRTTPWRETELGVHLLWFSLALATTFTALTLGVLIPEHPVWFDVLRAAAYTSTPVVVVWRVILQRKARHRPLNRHRKGSP